MIVVPTDFRVLIYGARLAHIESEPVEENEYAQVGDLVEYMVSVMRRWRCAGISAPQVGIFKRVSVVQRVGGGTLVLVNPEITHMHGKESDRLEGCISVTPATNTAMVARIEHVGLEYRTIGSLDQIRNMVLSGDEAATAQHEIDHLDGTFFFDRARAKHKVLRELKQWKEKRRNHVKQNDTGPLTTDRQYPDLSGVR